MFIRATTFCLFQPLWTCVCWAAAWHTNQRSIGFYTVSDIHVTFFCYNKGKIFGTNSLSHTLANLHVQTEKNKNFVNLPSL